MILKSHRFILTIGVLLCATATTAQTPATGPGSTQPSSASSSQQREATSSAAPEATTTPGTDPSDASTPHQQAVIKHSDNTAMNESDAKGDGVSAATFIAKASQDGLTEVQVASLAQQKSQRADVKKFADQMQTDHGKANSELQAIAAAKHIPVSTQLDPEHQAMVRQLSDKSGAAFDAAYASHMVQAHKKAVALFKQGSHSSDPDIAQFASKTLPTLEHHKTMAEALSSKSKMAAAAPSGATS